LIDRLLHLEMPLESVGHLKAVMTGVAIGAVLSVPMLVGANGWFALPFVLYPSLHVWIVISVFLAAVSSLERAKILGPFTFGFFGSLFARLFSPFGLFCLGWFYTSILAAVLTGAVD
jgi:hypothetical protein